MQRWLVYFQSYSRCSKRLIYHYYLYLVMMLTLTIIEVEIGCLLPTSFEFLIVVVVVAVVIDFPGEVPRRREEEVRRLIKELVGFFARDVSVSESKEF